MYNITVMYHAKLVDCYVFDSESFDLVEKSIKVNLLQYLKKYSPNEINFILGVVYPRVKNNGYINNVKLYTEELMKYGIKDRFKVRFIPHIHFYSTRALFYLKELNYNYKKGDHIKHYITDLINKNGHYLKLIKHDFGWRLDTSENHEPKDLVQFLQKLNNSSETIVYTDLTGGLMMVSSSTGAVEFTKVSVYLLKIYSNKTENYSCYIPLTNLYDSTIKFDGEVIHSIVQNEHILPFSYSLPVDATKVNTYPVENDCLSSLLNETWNEKSEIEVNYNDRVPFTVITITIDQNGCNDIACGPLYHREMQMKPYDHHPYVVLKKDSCSIKYYKNGILNELKDANGLTDIPTRISLYGDIPVVGSAALDDPYVLPYNILNLSDVFWLNESQKDPNLFIDENNVDWVIVNTSNGLRKLPTTNIIRTFQVSLIKLFRQKTKSGLKNFICVSDENRMRECAKFVFEVEFSTVLCSFEHLYS